MPEGAGPLASYARYYTGVMEAGRAKVQGEFIAYGIVPSSTPPVTIVEQLAPMMDGGCSAVTLDYDVQSKQMRLACHGQA